MKRKTKKPQKKSNVRKTSDEMTLYDRIQAVIRNPLYGEEFKKIAGPYGATSLIKLAREKQFSSLAKRWNIPEAFDPEFVEENKIGCYKEDPRRTSEPVQEIGFINGKLFALESGHFVEVQEDDKFIMLRIDTRESKDVIRKALGDFIDIIIRPSSGSRNRSSVQDHWKVWDEVNRGKKTVRQIAEEKTGIYNENPNDHPILKSIQKQIREALQKAEYYIDQITPTKKRHR